MLPRVRRNLVGRGVIRGQSSLSCLIHAVPVPPRPEKERPGPRRDRVSYGKYSQLASLGASFRGWSARLLPARWLPNTAHDLRQLIVEEVLGREPVPPVPAHTVVWLTPEMSRSRPSPRIRRARRHMDPSMLRR